MILDGYAAYLLAKQKALKTNMRYDIYADMGGFFIIPVGEMLQLQCVHIIRIEPTHRIMPREEYMKWL